MKKVLIVVVFVAALGAYAFYNYYSSKSAATSTAIATTTSQVATPVTPTTPTAPATTASQTAVATSGYKDGTYTGSVANAFYGNIQVQAIISGGKLTKVNFLQYPKDRGESVAINEKAMPILSSQAIAAQSAKVDGVSSASQTSEAFEQSLAFALTQAQG